MTTITSAKKPSQPPRWLGQRFRSLGESLTPGQPYYLGLFSTVQQQPTLAER